MKNKYLLIIVLGTAPLILLTIQSLLATGSTIPTTDARDSSSLLAQADEAIRRWEGRPTDAEPVIEKLRAVTLRPYEMSSALSTPASSPALRETEQFWSDYRQALELTLEFSKVVAGSVEFDNLADTAAKIPADNIEAARQKLGEFRSKVEESGSTRVAGRSELTPVIEDRLRKLATLTSRRTDELENEKTFNEASQQFSQQNYEACLSILAQWKGTDQSRIKELLSAAEYGREAQAVQARVAQTLRTKPDRAWMKAIGDVERFVLTPTPSDKSLQKLATQMQSELATLKRRLDVHEFLQMPISRLGDWCVQASALNSKYPEAVEECRDRLREKLRSYLMQGLAEIKTDSTDYQCIVMKTGKIVEGQFEPNADYFKHWKTKDERTSSPNKYRIVDKNDAAEGPMLPIPIQCTDRYNAARRQLVKSLESRDKWENVLAVCEQCEAAVLNYGSNGGNIRLVRNGDGSVSFSNEAVFARRVLDSWNDISAVFGTR